MKSSRNAVALRTVTPAQLKTCLKQAPKAVRALIAANDFAAKEDSWCAIPATVSGEKEASVLYGVGDAWTPWSLAAAPTTLPVANYRLETEDGDIDAIHRAWGLGSYQYSRYRKVDKLARLVVGNSLSRETEALIEATELVRDMINTPAADMTPEAIAMQAKRLAKKHTARFSQVVGDKLLEKNYPMIHAVGRASSCPPRLARISWGKKSHPVLALVGKGVAFDSGGLNMKNASGMRYMQKDMGGAAHVLGLADLVMTMQLPVRLEVFVPAVENAVSGNAYRPGDVLPSRAGLTVEIDNTDAEGRLILADALTDAGDAKPDLLIDFATLTGAARIAVGTEIAAFFTRNKGLSAELVKLGETLGDPVWPLPLHDDYWHMMKSNVADMVNSASSSYAGASTAALFLQQFVDKQQAWIHLDMMAWNTRKRSGRPVGGEAMGMRTVFRYLQIRYAD